MDELVRRHLRNKKMFTVFAQAYANLGDIWENSRADQCKPETEGRWLHLLESFHKRLRGVRTQIFFISFIK